MKDKDIVGAPKGPSSSAPNKVFDVPKSGKAGPTFKFVPAGPKTPVKPAAKTAKAAKPAAKKGK